MSAKRKTRVQVGALTATIYRWKNTSTGKLGWRFGVRDGDKWTYTTRATMAEAELAATQKLTALQAGELDWPALSRDRREFLTALHHEISAEDQEAVLSMLKSRRKSVDVTAATERFLEFKLAAKGHQTAHLEQMTRDLKHYALHFVGQVVSDISLAALADWWTLRTGAAGRHRQQALRRTLVSFYLWARKEGYTGPDATTIAERLPSLAVGGGDLYVYSTDELAVLLESVTPEFLPWLVFGAFAGMRPEEIAPKIHKATKARPNPPPAKPGLMWEHVDWEFKAIRLPKEVSKVGKKGRVIPLNPAALAWFEKIGANSTWKGRVCLRDASTVGETLRLGKILDERFKRATGWPADALRHSYGSYRNAVIRKLSQVAEEMGTSETMLHNHYHNPKTTEEGDEWFSMTPEMSSEKFRFFQARQAQKAVRLTA